jgi:hypothetical protein
MLVFSNALVCIYQLGKKNLHYEGVNSLKTRLQVGEGCMLKESQAQNARLKAAPILIE